MTRPSGHTDRLLIKAAREIFPETGCGKLSLHQVAKKAGVNLGMFHYHFKTKDVFINRVFQEFYDEFLQNFDLSDVRGGSSLESLRRVLLKVAFFVRDNQGFMLALMRDLINGEDMAIQFAKKNFARHVSILFKLIEDCQRAGLVESLPPPQIASFIMPGIIFPMMVASRIKAAKKISKTFTKKMCAVVVSDRAIAKRIDMALQGISTRKGLANMTWQEKGFAP